MFQDWRYAAAVAGIFLVCLVFEMVRRYRIRISWPKPKFSWKLVLWSPTYPLLAVCWLLFAYFCLWALFSLVGWFITPRPAPDPIVVAQAEKQQQEQEETAKKMTSLRNCLPASAKVTVFGPQVEVTIPASNSPVWGFVGVWLPQVGNVKGHVFGQGRMPADARYYLVEADIGGPLPSTELDSNVAAPDQMTSVIRLGKLHYTGNLGTNYGPGLCVWYVQSTVTTTTQKMRVQMEMPYADQTEQLLVEVGREEVVLNLPSNGFELAYVVPIRYDATYQSVLVGTSVSPDGLTTDELAQTLMDYGRANGLAPDWQEMVKLAEKCELQRPSKTIPYQALTMSVDEEEPAVPQRHWVALASVVSGKKIHLRLNADPDDLLAKDCRPAKVLVGWRKIPTSQWASLLGK